MTEMLVTNARLVLADRTLDGAMSVRDGLIRDIGEGPSAVADGVDFEGDFLIPGFVELHTDNLEKHLQPRPGVMWPSSAASVVGHDVQIAGAGITTVFDAVAVGEYSSASARRQMITTTVETVANPRVREVLRSEHLLHLRCELADPAVLDIYEPIADNPYVKLVSLMDHTPGQRQWADLAKWRQFNRDKKWTDLEFDQMVADRIAAQSQYVSHYRAAVIDLAREHGTVLASHDDTTPEHVDEAMNDGISISEFPTSIDAAAHAHRRGMKVVMGAPNVVRGGSHSGNVSAIDLVQRDLLDGLSSDYVPSSLMQSVFLLNQSAGIDLAKAVSFVSANPARMVGLNDRGVIEIGKRADFSRVRLIDGVPVILSVWREGRRVS
ncbi:alpha-D-ribose 1-methylphosphonate 5-triphosphate diphosphatase [Phyllobacterium zundukense]|jgi:alpha-D-ribose 1-methylphosphonate 5-triphosphate diphosphatase|uniref:Alpha-D-ribose 1-methylphosphonate 5-triphosphate diphosphatase n=1 Tax=Phyllobacterium zundukense TaxID=1867719 RepID=A0ACD4CUN2_9HYPH|nr:alpha-D-ribose 1-methylphosphonate 5-triphosphate diphosphatase [Phyllobacterium zundukense]UXN57296.1 alpha-D-ribose 1-methylphosphonate 5-triphosphate diphosphatase [Phyllobacterium zundukense]